MKKLLIMISLIAWRPAMAQEPTPAKADPQFFMNILLDKITTVGSLKACPSKDNPSQYFYLPNKVRIATDETTGEPKFSFIRYVTNKRSGAEESEIREGEGGGWVHALIGLKVTEEEIAGAQSELSRKVPGAQLVGPTIYRSGTVSLVTKSAATNDKVKVLGIERAPVLDGDVIAVGFPLNETDAAILWETMKGPNPDVSLNFDMTLAGLNAPIGAKMEVNWDVLNTHRLMNLSVDVPIFKVEVSDMVTELRQNGTIKITTVGNKPLDTALIRRIENYVLDICFSKNDSSLARSRKNFVIESTPGKSRRDLERRRADSLARAELKMLDAGSGADSTSFKRDSLATAKREARKDELREEMNGIQLADFSIQAVYHRAKIKRTGQFVVDLNHYDPVTLQEPFGGNIGRIKCRNCLLEVNTASHLYTQRELVAFLDGGALADFDKYINFVTVRMRKKHQAGDLTYDEIRIDRKNFNTKGNAFKMMYGWGNGDNDRRAWLEYDYQTTWNFFGGHTVGHDWKTSNENVIGISPPYTRSEIRLIADKEQLKALAVRAVSVKVYYKLGEKEYVKKATLNPANEVLQQQVEVILPRDEPGYTYEAEWILNDNTTVSSGRVAASSDMLFVDVLPKTH